jgi:hypothetical protein
MSFDYLTSGVVGVIAGILGVLISAVIQPLWAGKIAGKRKIREQKLDVLKDLTATKFTLFSDKKAAEAINYIPLLFVKDKKVLDAYVHYHEIYLTSPLNEALGLRFNNLIVEIARNVGITIHPIDLQRRPVICMKDTLEQEELPKKVYCENQLEYVLQQINILSLRIQSLEQNAKQKESEAK